MIKGKQHTIHFHVDDILLSHKDLKVNDIFAEWCQGQYGQLKSVEVHRGKVHWFLVVLDFSVEGECKVQQFSHVDDMIESFPEEIGSKISLTLASSLLYDKGEC